MEQHLADATVFDFATELIRIGPSILYWSQVEELELGMLRAMQTEIQDRFRVPVTLDRLTVECQRWSTSGDMQSKKQYRRYCWASTVEAISQCVVAFQKAADAAERSQCKDVAAKLCAHVAALAEKLPVHIESTALLTLLYDFIENRTYNLAARELWHQYLSDHEESHFWSRIVEEAQKDACLHILEICLKDTEDQEHLLRDRMSNLNPIRAMLQSKSTECNTQ